MACIPLSELGGDFSQFSGALHEAATDAWASYRQHFLASKSTDLSRSERMTSGRATYADMCRIIAESDGYEDAILNLTTQGYIAARRSPAP